MNCNNVSTVISSQKWNYAAGDPLRKTAERCCEWSPFLIIGNSGQLARPTPSIEMRTVYLAIPAGFGAVAEVRYGYQDIVLCALYHGGGDSAGAHGNQSDAMPARPFRVALQ